MQKWWLVGAGVVGVGLAVLLLGRPLDTGGDVGPVGAVDVTLTEGEVAQPGELVRGPNGEMIERPGSGVTNPTVAVEGAQRSPLAMVRPGTVPVDPSLIVAGANPAAARAAARRDTPEARLAAQTTAPWTQIRRELARAAGDDPAASELIGDVQVVLDDLKHTQRDPQSVDFEDVRTHQDAVLGRVRESKYYNTEIERMISLLEERNSDYKEQLAGQ